jgi:hypothetical protein
MSDLSAHLGECASHMSFGAVPEAVRGPVPLKMTSLGEPELHLAPGSRLEERARLKIIAKSWFSKLNRSLVPPEFVGTQTKDSAGPPECGYFRAADGVGKRDGEIFAIEHKGVDYFPFYSVPEQRTIDRIERLPNPAPLLSIPRRVGAVFWFANRNRFLDDHRPQDLWQAIRIS